MPSKQPHDEHRSSDRRREQRYQARPYEGMPSVTNREWGERDASRQHSFGPGELGGHGDLRTGHQGGYAQDQGRHAQSGHGRGGSAQGSEQTSRGADGGRQSHRGRGPKNYRRSDQSITDEIYDRLTDDDHIDASEILVMVENGVVTLTGEVPARHMKHRAEDLADAMRGVSDIDNRIRVDRGADSFGPPGAAMRSGDNQPGSGFSSSARIDSARIDDPLDEQPVERQDGGEASAGRKGSRR
ncbi:MAG: BON domain-containing protein [Proteobacteria bacterium]|nr:BON domain-containing protein [Pseudomonadota bacterium]